MVETLRAEREVRPFAIIVNVAMGAWLVVFPPGAGAGLASPAVIDALLGTALVATALLATWPVAFRAASTALALALLSAPWIFGYESAFAIANDALAAAVVLVCSWLGTRRMLVRRVA